ncbi:MAG TPA: type II toxin-antitoxin system VapC family toxin [Chitinophagales bacterium]|nr:type II toxin-antitoxin system VapC family toxin [Chitinophagales bacterium]HRK27071.1 type II toxin-antitoxin system VapC family toxin [Chitinophagales bacterium]
MRLLLDTHTFLWYYSGSAELSDAARACIDDINNEFWISTASLWEIAIKHSIGKLDLDGSFEEFCQDVVNKGFIFMPIDIAHLITLAGLPFHHRDPFDRILVAQAITENLNFVSKDSIVDDYFFRETEKRIW